MEEFIKNFADQFEDTELSVFKPETKFRELEEWSSMMTLSILSMAEDEYGVELSSSDMRACETIEELYNLIQTKK